MKTETKANLTNGLSRTDASAMLPAQPPTTLEGYAELVRCLELALCDKEQQIILKEQQIAAIEQKYQHLLELFKKLQAERFAPRAEDYQPKDAIFNEAELLEDEDKKDELSEQIEETKTSKDDTTTAVKSHQSRGRKPINSGLPRKEMTYELPQEERICACCQGELHEMSQTVTEQIDIIPKHIQVLRFVRKTYACRQCEKAGENHIVNAPMPIAPLPGSIASPSTLAVILTAKYVSGMPLYRLEDEVQRAGLSLSRTTLANWVIKSSNMLMPIYAALKSYLLSEPLIHGDESTLQVLKEEGRKAQNKSYMWAYCSGEHSENPVVLFEYQPHRSGDVPTSYLDGWEGALMSDGYSAWRMLPNVTSLGCMAHARRKFNDALKAKGPQHELAHFAMKQIQRLYAIESTAKGFSIDKRYRMRQTEAIPILDTLHDWLKNVSRRYGGTKTLLSKAVSYMLNQWEYLKRYTEDGRWPIDNNRIEREIRPLAVARKSWLFADTVKGADASALHYSLMLTCRANEVDPYAWLVHVFTELPQRAKDADITDLLPFNFNK